MDIKKHSCPFVGSPMALVNGHNPSKYRFGATFCFEGAFFASKTSFCKFSPSSGTWRSWISPVKGLGKSSPPPNTRAIRVQVPQAHTAASARHQKH